MPAPAPPAPGIGAFIRDKRKERGLTGQALADLLDLHQTTVSGWERGRGLGSIPAHTTALARVLHLEPETIRRLWWDEMGGYLAAAA